MVATTLLAMHAADDDMKQLKEFRKLLKKTSAALGQL